MAIHVATFVLVHVDSITGEIFTKDGSTMKKFTSENLNKPIERARNFSTEARVNTTGYPTLEDYLEAEAGAGFKFKHLDQTYIITES